MKYLLPCSCGKSVTIEVSQAGQQVRCECGQLLDVPPFRAIRTLPPAVPTGRPTAPAKPAWSPVRGVVFAVGMLLFVGGLAAAGYLQLGRSTLRTEAFEWDNLEMAMEGIDGMNVEQTWELWQILRDESIGPYSPPSFIMSRFVSDFWYRYVIGGLVMAGCGAVMALAAYVIRF